MKNLVHISLVCMLAAFLVGCGSQETDDASFKRVVALVELQKVHTGAYPERLEDLTFAGYWDAIWLRNVEYRKLPSGYELNITGGWIREPKLSYPKEFWQGLGLVKSNVTREP